MNKSHTARHWGTKWVGGAGGMTTQDKDSVSQERPCVFDSSGYVLTVTFLLLLHLLLLPRPKKVNWKPLTLTTASYEKTLSACVCVCLWLGVCGGGIKEVTKIIRLAF